MKIALIGFGKVGRGVVEVLKERAPDLKAQGFDPVVVAVTTAAHGSLYYPGGLDYDDLLAHADDLSKYPVTSGLRRTWDTLRVIKDADADVVVEVTPTNLQTGQPALDHIREALKSGKHVVTANKGPVAVAYDELNQLAAEHNRLFKFETTIIAGTPALRIATYELVAAGIVEVRGILNSTANYVLSQMERGKSYDDALQMAIDNGYAETDMAADVDGWDTACKVQILGAAVFGRKLTLDDLWVEGISSITRQDVQSVGTVGKVFKLIASVSATGGGVKLERLDKHDPLAQVEGATNAITFRTKSIGDVTLIAAGAGARETGFGLLSDLLAIHRQM